MQVNGRTKAPLVTISEVAPDIESQPNEQEENHLSVPVAKNQIDRTFQRRESILSSNLSLYIQKEKPKIPDGGWGWLVVAASFLINMISDGVGYTFGLLYVEFLHEFKASKSATSWIGSLFMAMPLITGKFYLFFYCYIFFNFWNSYVSCFACKVFLYRSVFRNFIRRFYSLIQIC